MSDFDFRNPDYVSVFQKRIERLNRVRAEPDKLPYLKAHYKNNIAQFINDWGCTYDPRNIEVGRPATVPFMLFPKQREWIDWIVNNWKTRSDGITEKSRDMGISWLAVAVGASLCIFHEGMAIGFGSKTEDDVDKSGDPQSLFWKARQFVMMLPPEFRSGFDGSKNCTSHMRLSFPETGSIVKGDAGDDIGRGDRTSIYFVDESASLARPALVDAALSQTTNCRQDLSTPRGRANRFAERRFSGKVKVFSFHWRDDPRKDDVWYDAQKEKLDPVTLAQEVDMDYSASVEGVLIPSKWVQAAVDAHVKLGIKPTGARTASLDVADEGKDMNSFCGAHGVVIETLDEWSGKGDDIFGTTARAFRLCDEGGYSGFKYDSDGLGAGVRGDARVLNEARQTKLAVDAFRGSEAVFDPEGEAVKGRKNKDYFLNRKAQAWWALRTRFQNTYRAVVEGADISPDDIISIPSNLDNRQKLCNELSQPTYSISAVGKIVVDKAPEGTKSPNLADSVMIQFSVSKRPAIKINPALLSRMRA